MAEDLVWEGLKIVELPLVSVLPSFIYNKETIEVDVSDLNDHRGKHNHSIVSFIVLFNLVIVPKILDDVYKNVVSIIWRKYN